MKIIVVSDIHLNATQPELYGLKPEERLTTCIEDINANHRDAELVVFNGDLTYRGNQAAYYQLRDLLTGLKPPHRLLLGNHDHRGLFRQVFPEAPVDRHGFIQSVHDARNARLIFLDTNAEMFHYGVLCPDRLAWLAERLAEEPTKPTYLFMHHPAIISGLKMMDQAALRNPDLLAEVLEPFDQIRFIFWGHLHRPITGLWQDRPYCILRSTNHQVAFDLETDQLLGCNEPPAYGIALIEPDQTVIHFHDFLDDSPTYPLGKDKPTLEKNP